MSIIKGQSNASPQRGLPVDDKGASSTIQSITGETVALYYWNSGVRTADAGQSAGVLCEGKLAYDNIRNSSGSMQGTSVDKSLSFTSTAFTTEKPFPATPAESVDDTSGADRISAICAGFSNGDYTVDYSTGMIYGKKATTQTSLTSTSYKIGQNVVGSGGVSSDINVAKVGGTTVPTKGSLPVVPSILVDSNGNQITNMSILQPNFWMGKNIDGVASYTSNVTITITGASFTVDSNNCYITSLFYKPTAGSWTPLYNGMNGVSITASSDVLTVAGAGTPFASGDDYLIGVIYNPRSYEQSSDSQKNTQINPDSEKRVDPVPLIDTTNVAAATNYYPSTAGFSMDGFRHLNIQGVTSGGVTTTIEATNDPASSPDWIDITKACYDMLTNTNGNASFIDNSFLLDLDTLNVQYVRIKSVTSDATNAVQYSYRQIA